MGWGRWWEGPECCAYAGAGIDGARGHGVVGGVVKPVQGVGVRVAGSRGVPHSACTDAAISGGRAVPLASELNGDRR